MSDVECITLDDSGDDSPPHHGFVGAPAAGGQYPGAPPGPSLAANYQKSLGARRMVAPIPVVREEQMMRCNLCVDPGLLPVEEDRAAHRRKVHSNKLFYCDGESRPNINNLGIMFMF